jgi:hypothetical protein
MQPEIHTRAKNDLVINLNFKKPKKFDQTLQLHLGKKDSKTTMLSHLAIGGPEIARKSAITKH